MTVNTHNFLEVSLIITHYNRPDSLKRLLQSFEDLHCTFGEVIVSDDGSKPDNLSQLRTLQNSYGFNLITSKQNYGLGHNINKGQRAVKKEFTLYVQEDFVPTMLLPQKLYDALRYLNEDQDLDIVRFYAYTLFPFLKPFANGFSLMIFDVANILSTYKKFYMYSDHPHIRRSTFPNKFGPYIEGVNVEKTEYLMMISFLKNKGKGLFYTDYQELFKQINSSDEPSTFKRNWRRHPNLIFGVARHLYRHIKFNYDLRF